MRLIDADALNETLMNIEFKYPKDTRTFAEKAKDIGTMCAMLVANQIVNAPTVDAVNVTRCKDCRYYRASRSINDVTITECLYAMPEWTEPNGYCHRAKRVKHEETT